LNHHLGGADSKYADVLDGWSLSHFTFFAVLGLAFPDHMYAAMGYGLLWEGLEFMAQHTDNCLVDWLRGVSLRSNNNSKVGEHYFYAKGTDIIMNLSGFKFMLGSGVRFAAHKLH
jgi:hypothetical protein